jgi:hypothetical protein
VYRPVQSLADNTELCSLLRRLVDEHGRRMHHVGIHGHGMCWDMGRASRAALLLQAQAHCDRSLPASAMRLTSRLAARVAHFPVRRLVAALECASGFTLHGLLVP